MNWTEARQFCREKYTDLATFDSMDDLSRLKADFSYSWAWFGLWDDPENWRTSMANDTNSWRWSATGETSRTGYQNWASGEPDYLKAKETCVAMGSNALWSDANCETTREFICYNENNKKTYFHIPTKKTWQSAQQHCREHFTDLAMIENEAENTKANEATQGTGSYWIGLYRNPWTWSDRSQSSFRNWNHTKNNNDGQQQCGEENPQHEWGDDYCDYKKPFICHQGLPLSSCSQPPPRQYHYVSTPKNWTEARQFCREKYTDLATFDNMDDISRLKADFSYSWAWIGLWDDPENWKTSMGNDTNSWRWSATGETSRTGYQNWESSDPNYWSAKETCVAMRDYGLWIDANCEYTNELICYNVSENKKNYFHIPTKKTWQSAHQHCRENFTDLAMIENEAENTEAQKAKPDTRSYWIGTPGLGLTGAKAPSGSGTTQKITLMVNNTVGKKICNMNGGMIIVTLRSPSSAIKPPLRQYHYVSTPKSWTEARQFCREKYTDLATFDSMDDISRLEADLPYLWAWNGLWDDPENWKTSMGNDTNSWRWSATGETSRTGYQNWDSDQPDYWEAQETCVLMRNQGLWVDERCETPREFICYS
ncbi:unnamed protein product, partial [Menidia menidia]